MRLIDTTVIVTGASSGLGRSMATAFVREGARVVFASRSERRLAAVVDSLRSEDPPGEAMVVPTDVRSWADAQNLLRECQEAYGDVDVLVNNAGISQLHATGDHAYRPVHEIPVEAWNAVLSTNLTGVFHCTRAVLPSMRRRGSGRVIHVSSGHGVSGRPERAAYVASKFGLEGFHESLALELDGTGVESLAFRPPSGGVYTERAGEYGRPRDSYAHPRADVVAEPAVRLAAGEGENGGRYQAVADGEGYVEYGRA